MAGATASTSPTPLGGTGSAAQAGAMGSSGGTTVGTLACSSCCGPQGKYLVGFFGGYGYTGLCPGAIDNSKPFTFVATCVITFTPPYTAAMFCVPSSFSASMVAYDYINATNVNPAVCTTNVTPPTTRIGYPSFLSSSYGQPAFAPYPNGLPGGSDFTLWLARCECDTPTYPYFSLEIGNVGTFSSVSCSPVVFSGTTGIRHLSYLAGVDVQVGTVAITLTF